MNEIKLNQKQAQAYDLMSKGNNIFLTGPGGVGKTALIKFFVEKYKHLKKIALTSTTGTSALLLGGTTLHSYLGIGLGTASADSLITLLFKRPYIRKKWYELDVLIIDEISMLTPDLFDKLNTIAKSVRRSFLREWGGIQIILSGDFLQLPCVDTKNFCFEAETWESSIHKTIYLTDIIRQDDTTFQDFLNNVRIANITPQVIQILNERKGKKIENKYGIIPTKLFPLNHAVDSINLKEFTKLDEQECYEYDIETIIHSPLKKKQNYLQLVDKYKKNCTAPERLQLCKGAQVMLLYNLDLEAKLANGSRGIVVDFIDDLPMVKFLNGETRLIDHHTWENKEGDVHLIDIIQIPLKLAYAISIHKIQGASLDCVEINLRNIFEYGQAYVALSRVKTLEGLNVVDFDINKIKAHPKAIEYYKRIN